MNLSPEQLRQQVVRVLEEMRHQPIPLGVSSRHVHLSEKDYTSLFPDHPMTVRKPLRQPGQFAAEESVTLIGPKGSLAHVRILGPVRTQTQIELSRTDARLLGISPPLRLSGQLTATPGIRLVSPFAEITLPQGVIVALRHLHMSPADALIFGVQQGDMVNVAIEGSDRRTIFEDVAVRVSPDMVLEMHIDTDEANAADVDYPGACARILDLPGLDG